MRVNKIVVTLRAALNMCVTIKNMKGRPFAEEHPSQLSTVNDEIEGLPCTYKGGAYVGVTRYEYGATLTVEDSGLRLNVGWPFYNLFIPRETIKDIEIIKAWGRIDTGIRINHEVKTYPSRILFAPHWWPKYLKDIRNLGHELRNLKTALYKAQYPVSN